MQEGSQSNAGEPYVERNIELSKSRHAISCAAPPFSNFSLGAAPLCTLGKLSALGEHGA